MEKFYEGFWPNFVSSIIAGLGLGFLFSWLLAKKIGEKLNNKERQLSELISKKEGIDKTIQYFEILIDEILKIQEIAKNRKGLLDIDVFLSVGVIVFDNSLWVLLEASGEITKYLSPKYQKIFSTFFSNWNTIIQLEKRINMVITNASHFQLFPKEVVDKINQYIGDINFLLEEIEPAGNVLVRNAAFEVFLLKKQKEEINSKAMILE